MLPPSSILANSALCVYCSRCSCIVSASTASLHPPPCPAKSKKKISPNLPPDWTMDSLPDPIFEHILSYVNNARDIASCNCVSKRWNQSTNSIRNLHFPCNSKSGEIVKKMVSASAELEELVVYCPFTVDALDSWLSPRLVALSLSRLELRIENDAHAWWKLVVINAAKNLQSLKLWGDKTLLQYSPCWGVFKNLRTLEIFGVKLNDHVLNDVLRSCPNLTNLLLGCEVIKSVSIDLPYLQHCKLEFTGVGVCSVLITSPEIETLEVHGCGWISVPMTRCLRNLTMSFDALIEMLDFGDLVALEFLAMKGGRWDLDSMHKMLKLASGVNHLCLNAEFSMVYEARRSELGFIDLFDSLPKLRKLEIGAYVFAALCQGNSLMKHVVDDLGFVIPCLKEVTITVKSPLNAEQKISALESLLKYGKNLRSMVIRILHTKSLNGSAGDSFSDEISRLRNMNPEIVRIIKTRSRFLSNIYNIKNEA